jgi:hypothetical protein
METQNVYGLLQRNAELEKELAAKNRELDIEAALERVRKRAMAMQTSSELSALIKTVYAEMIKLDSSLDRCLIMVFDPKTKGTIWWMAGGEDVPIDRGYYVQHSEHPWQLAFEQAWEERQEEWRYVIDGEEKKEFDAFLFTATQLSELPGAVIQNMRSFERIHNTASFGNFGCILTGSVQPLSSESFNVLFRFTKVFDLSYTRFLDLKKAEAQAREARIEALLERVRARTMAMQKSDELEETNMLIMRQLGSLDISLSGTGIHICHADRPVSEAWMWDMLAGRCRR